LERDAHPLVKITQNIEHLGKDKMVAHHGNPDEDSDDDDNVSHVSGHNFGFGGNDNVTFNGGVPPLLTGTLDAYCQFNPITICQLELFRYIGVGRIWQNNSGSIDLWFIS